MFDIVDQGNRNLTRVIGTTTVFPHGDERLRPIELGASIFVSANRHLVKGAKVRYNHLFPLVASS